MSSSDKRGLLVLVGAGASYDCSEIPLKPRPHEEFRGPSERLPLVADLFRPNQQLDEFPTVRSMAGDLRYEMGDGASSVEKHLRALVRHRLPSFRRAARLVPLYLQARLASLSAAWEPHSENYAHLVWRIFDATQDVAYMTLNYDRLLDHHLAAHQQRPFESIDSFISDRWLLIKPHGSIDWGYKVIPTQEDRDHNRNVLEIMDELGDEFRGGLSTGVGLVPEYDQFVRRFSDYRPNSLVAGFGSELYYPALAVPLGAEENSVICPQSHIEIFRNWLSGRRIDLLVIGYSGLDRAALSIIASVDATIRTMCIVSGSDSDAQSTMAAIVPELSYSGPMPGMSGKGFREFVSKEIRPYLNSLKFT